jgi:hypothetical protein
MKAIWPLLKLFALLLAMGGFVWVVAVGCDHVWPEAKWFFVGIFVVVWGGMLVFMFVRSFAGSVSGYRAIIGAYTHRRIDTAELPSDFRFISHDTTLAEIVQNLGPASRIVELPLPHRDGDVEHFMAHEYDLPYDAAVIIMPQRPFGPEDTIRAVCVRKLPTEEELLAPPRLKHRVM